MVRDMELLYSELFEAAGVGRRFGERIAAGQGQSQARWQTMWIIDQQQLSVPQAARRLGISRQSVQRVIDDLLDQAMVEAVPNPDHKTSPLYRLTDQGGDVLRAINADATRAHERLLEQFPLDDVQQLRRLLAALSAATRSHDDA